MDASLESHLVQVYFDDSLAQVKVEAPPAVSKDSTFKKVINDVMRAQRVMCKKLIQVCTSSDIETVAFRIWSPTTRRQQCGRW